jgi:alpha-mannosidase
MNHQIRWTSQKIAKYLALIEPLVYSNRWLLPPFRFIQITNASPSVSDIEDSFVQRGWKEIKPNTYWGSARINFVLKTEFQVPEDWKTNQPLSLYLPIGVAGDFSHPEALVYIDGYPYAACDRHHQEIPLREGFTSGKTHYLILSGWAGSLNEGQDIALRMGEPALVQIHQPTRDFIALTRVSLGIADNLEPSNPTQSRLYTALNEAFKLLDVRQPINNRFYESISSAYRALKSGVQRAGMPLDVEIKAIGHAHLDLAWLWTLDQTRQKAVRTFHNVIRLMEQFPEFYFAQSQAQLYEWVQQDDPELFTEISNKVVQGNWEPVGGMWVEADCNLSGGEALVRQFLLGTHYFEEVFGGKGRTSVLWLPDVFGFPGNLPQLAVEAGLSYFFTIKLGWSQYDRIPYDSFWWQGIDGTRLLTHFSTTQKKDGVFASTYNAEASPYEALSTWRNFQGKDAGASSSYPQLLMVYGYGDGGGGPTREMIENLRLMEHFPATPRINMGRVDEFFEGLEKNVGASLPVWVGELYLEYHRGTYTTQAKNKRANRKSEFLLHDAEFLASMADVFSSEYSYPFRKLRYAWKLLCLNQFHDVLPGTSIHEVYQKSHMQYLQIFEMGEEIQDTALSAIWDQVGGDILIVNPTSFARSDLIFLDGGLPGVCCIARTTGQLVETQPVEGGILLDLGEVLPYSITPLMIGRGVKPSDSITSSGEGLSVSVGHLENRSLRVELNSSGEITRLYDKQNHRELLPPETVANQIQAFEDIPRTPDAWEIDIYYDDKMYTPISESLIRVVEEGPLRVAVEIEHSLLNSKILQRISLPHNSQRLDFDTRVDWRERNILLKAAFPVEILSPYATHEIQWGSIRRPTHRNTTWDWAKFEVPAHKWIDLSEGGYGVSLLNDCKYGHDVHGNVMRITLLRGTTYPDPQADIGEHHFVYSLFPHQGSSLSNTIRESYALNDPYIVWLPDKSHPLKRDESCSFIQVESLHVVLETIKVAEDGNGLILRLYETNAQRGKFVIKTGFKIAKAWRSDILEKNKEEIEVEEQRIIGYILPYQILTYRVIPASAS